MAVPADNDINELLTNAKLQMSEIEMLQSMFPGEGEFVIQPQLQKELEMFCEGRFSSLPSNVCFCLNLNLSNGHLELEVTLPTSYPNSSYPCIYIRSSLLSKIQHNSINQGINSYLKSLELGELCVGPMITWLQENGDGYFDASENKQSSTISAQVIKFVRLWIYSHHIYSKTKRKDILELSKQHNLTGFCLPGKPGIICVEGIEKNVEAWWHEVRKWTWQKILCKNREEENIDTDDCNFRRFVNFEELGSDNEIRVKNGGYHVDMGDVYKYLEKHKSGYMFEEYFGFPGKS